MSETLTRKAFVGVGWSAIERLSLQGVGFVLQIILARLLSASDYGIIAMIAIFLQIAGVFVDSGFANALIQKQNCTDKDYSTVFYYNLAVSIGVYGLLYIGAPLVAKFYDIELLTKVLRVSALVVIFNAFSLVQRTKLVKQIDFKSQSIVNFSSAVISGIAGIAFAYYGFGVWALCFQSLLNSILQIFLFYFFVRWRPSLVFSRESFKELFSFGSKILIASIISVVYNNLYTIVIGKKFKSEELGYYSRADQFAAFPSINISSIIAKVAFPALSTIQNDDDKLRIAYRKIIRYSSFVIFPIMIGLAASSKFVVLTLLGEKWLDVVPFLRILCFALMWDHLSSLNLNLLYVKGKSNLVLKLEIIKKTIAVAILFASIPFGIVVMCWGRVVYDIIAFGINTFYTKRLIGISLFRQIMDIMPYLVLSLAMGVLVFVEGIILPSGPLVTLVLVVLTGVVFYSAISWFSFKDIREQVVSLIRSNKRA